MGQKHPGLLCIAAAGAVAAFGIPSQAQMAGHAGGGGHMSAPHMNASHMAAPHMSAPHMAAPRMAAPARSFGGGYRAGGPQLGGIRPRAFGASSVGRPWELPRNPTPHWELGAHGRPSPNGYRNHTYSHTWRNYGYGNPYPLGYGVGYVGLPFYGDSLDMLGDDGDDPNDVAPQQSQSNDPQYAEAPQYNEGASYQDGPQGPESAGLPPEPRVPYYPQGYPPPPQAASPAQSAAAQGDGLDHPDVTLVFNDGRPPLKVKSYVLTGSSVFIADRGHQREIPLTALNLPETVAQNREAGVNFQLPGNGTGK